MDSVVNKIQKCAFKISTDDKRRFIATPGYSSHVVLVVFVFAMMMMMMMMMMFVCVCVCVYVCVFVCSAACEFELCAETRVTSLQETRRPYSLLLRAPSVELKCTWKNILEQRILTCEAQRQMLDSRRVDNIV